MNDINLNKQESVGNGGVGNIGNQINKQNQIDAKVQNPNDTDRITSLENRVGALEKERKWLLVACACSVSICVAFFLGFLFIKCNFPSDISLFVASLVVGFIGALATLVVVRNESQIREVKNEFGRDVHKIEEGMEKRLDNSLDSVHHVVEAIGYQSFAVSYFDRNSSLALEYFMCALDQTNKATKTWNVVDGIIQSILMLKEERAMYVIVSLHKKREYREILTRCKHEKKNEVLEFIESRNERYIPKPNSPWSDRSSAVDSAPEK